MKIKVIALLAVAALGFLLLASACDEDSGDFLGGSGSERAAAVTVGQQEGISVSGQGSVTLAPDTAILNLGVSVLRPSARQARDDAAQAMDALLSSLKSNGIEDDDIKTSQFSISPEIDFRDGQQEIRGYRVTNLVSAKVRDIERIGEIIDEAVDAAGDPVQVGGIAFTVDDPTEPLKQARASAMADAKAKAQALADLADVDLGRPIFISESSFGAPPVPFAAPLPAAERAELATPIQPGELEVTVSVQVVYAIR